MYHKTQELTYQPLYNWIWIIIQGKIFNSESILLPLLSLDINCILVYPDLKQDDGNI